MNKALAQTASNAITDPHFEDEDGWCQKMTRQVIQRVYGSKYDAFHKRTAKLSAEEWVRRGIGVPYHGQPLEAGDIVYKTHGSGAAGHVGIVATHPRLNVLAVAENSSTSIGRVSGAKGYRTIGQWGKIDVLVRLPEPHSEAKPAEPKPEPKIAPQPKLVLALKRGDDDIKYTHLQSAVLKDGHFQVEPSEVLQSLLGLAGKVPIAELLKQLKVVPYGQGNHLNDPSEPRLYLFIDMNVTSNPK